MYRFAAALLIFMSGCGRDHPDSTGGFGSDFSEMTASGLRVRYANDQPPRLDQINTYYLEVTGCMGLEPAPGPIVIIADGVLQRVGTDARFFYPETVVVDSRVTTINPVGLGSSAMAFPFKHEFVHYLLDRSGFPRDANFAHESPFFEACGHGTLGSAS